MKEKKISEITKLPERVCPVCGKLFFLVPEHVYKDRRAPYKKVCSWGCVCKSERLNEEAKALKKARKGDAK